MELVAVEFPWSVELVELVLLAVELFEDSYAVELVTVEFEMPWPAGLVEFVWLAVELLVVVLLVMTYDDGTEEDVLLVISSHISLAGTIGPWTAFIKSVALAMVEVVAL